MSDQPEVNQESDHPGDEFGSDYISTVVRYAQKLAQQEDRRISILDLCTGGGFTTKALLEQLIAEGIDLRMLLVDNNPYGLHSAWELMGPEGPKLKFLLRDITNINKPIEISSKVALEKAAEFGPHSKTPNPEMLETYLRIAYYEDAGASPFDTETQIDDGSIDMLIGSGPFSFLSEENYDEVVRNAIDRTTRLVREGGYAIFTTGFNEPEEIKAREKHPPRGLVKIIFKFLKREKTPKPLALGVSQAGLDARLRANGLVLHEGPRKYTIEGLSPFHYAEVFAYKKDGN